MIGPKVPRMTPGESKRGYARVADRSFGLCESCGHEEATQMHHRKYRSRGGDECPSNLIHLCVHCHRRAHNDPDSAANGWSVASTADPGRVKVLYRGTWMLLTPDGGLNET